MSWLQRHRESESFVYNAEQAKRAGDEYLALSCYKKAAKAEAEALDFILPGKDKTLGVTAISAAALFYKANEHERAEELVLNVLARKDMPPFAKEQLKSILQTIWNERVFKLSGVEFMQGELLVSVAGGLVGIGAAPLELVHRKIEEVKNLFFRSIEFLLDLPLRQHGPVSQKISEEFRPWILQAPAGSYQFALRIEKPRQLELFQTATPAITKITDMVLRIVEISAEGSLEELDYAIPKKDYKDYFVKQIRNLAPTGKTYETLTLRSAAYDSRPVVITPQSRKILTDSLKIKAKKDINSEPANITQVKGVLRAVHLDKDWLDVLDDSGATVRVFQAGDAIDDLIGPMVNHRVIVDSTLRPDGKHIFNDIQSEE